MPPGWRLGPAGYQYPMTERHSVEDNARLEEKIREDARHLEETHDPLDLGDPGAGEAVREMGEKRSRS